jgi:hypothetical protein
VAAVAAWLAMCAGERTVWLTGERQGAARRLWWCLALVQLMREQASLTDSLGELAVHGWRFKGDIQGVRLAGERQELCLVDERSGLL